MNKQTQEALKMAIEALDNACMKIEKWTKGGKWTAGKDALNACKEALASYSEALEQPAPNIDYDLYRNVDRPVNPEGHKK